jgi:rare lipoprotein A
LQRCATLAALVAALALAGCAGRSPTVRRPPAPPPDPSAPAPGRTTPGKPGPTIPPAAPGSFLEEGNASWYGVPFHGRRTSNGEVYDMHQLTAAHRTLPFSTVVRVTNLTNGKQTDVRITDRGPFVEGRIIDLSMGAAREIDMVGAGVARVRLELISGPHPTAGQFTVQVGAFAQKENATRLRISLEQKYQPILVQEYDSPKGKFYRVRVGRLPSEDRAQRLAERLQREQQLKTFVVRLDE